MEGSEHLLAKGRGFCTYHARAIYRPGVQTWNVATKRLTGMGYFENVAT